jgi:hypothetical protein
MFRAIIRRGFATHVGPQTTIQDHVVFYNQIAEQKRAIHAMWGKVYTLENLIMESQKRTRIIADIPDSEPRASMKPATK